jgi:uncharacterized membrane protein
LGYIDVLLEGQNMTQDEINQIYQRIAWLERKMVRLLWALTSVVSLFAGWLVSHAVFGDSPGWLKVGVFVAIWLVVGWILIRMELKGAPEHIEYIDP